MSLPSLASEVAGVFDASVGEVHVGGRWSVP
jgi:hypothetical protein